METDSAAAKAGEYASGMLMKVYVIGATGYLGKPLLMHAETKFPACGTTSSSTEHLLSLRLDEPVRFDYDCIQGGDVVILTAAISSPDVCSKEYELAWSINVTGTSTFVNNVIARGARVIFFSSDTVYGEREVEFDEAVACNPAGEYAEMKCEVEQRFAGNASFKAIRLSYVFSREDKFSRYLADCVERNEAAALFHPFFRAIVHRDDVVEGALALAENWDEVPEQVINFGGPQVLSRIDFAECLREAYFNDLRFKVMEPGEDFFNNRPRVIAMKSPVFARLLGRQPRTLFEAARLEFPHLQMLRDFHD